MEILFMPLTLRPPVLLSPRVFQGTLLKIACSISALSVIAPILQELRMHRENAIDNHIVGDINKRHVAIISFEIRAKLVQS